MAGQTKRAAARTCGDEGQRRAFGMKSVYVELASCAHKQAGNWKFAPRIQAEHSERRRTPFAWRREVRDEVRSSHAPEWVDDKVHLEYALEGEALVLKLDLCLQFGHLLPGPSSRWKLPRGVQRQALWAELVIPFACNAVKGMHGRVPGHLSRVSASLTMRARLFAGDHASAACASYLSMLRVGHLNVHWGGMPAGLKATSFRSDGARCASSGGGESQHKAVSRCHAEPTPRLL